MKDSPLSSPYFDRPRKGYVLVKRTDVLECEIRPPTLVWVKLKFAHRYPWQMQTKVKTGRGGRRKRRARRTR